MNFTGLAVFVRVAAIAHFFLRKFSNMGGGNGKRPVINFSPKYIIVMERAI